MAPGYSLIQTHSGARHWPRKWISWADGIRLGAGSPGRVCQLLLEHPPGYAGSLQEFQGLSRPSCPVPKQSAYERAHARTHTHTHTLREGLVSPSLTKDIKGQRGGGESKTPGEEQGVKSEPVCTQRRG